MSHEIMSALARRRRVLRKSDESRYQTLRLVVQRVGTEKAVVSLLFTDVGGHRLLDTRLGVATIPTRDSNGVPLDAHAILQVALDSLRSEP